MLSPIDESLCAEMTSWLLTPGAGYALACFPSLPHAREVMRELESRVMFDKITRSCGMESWAFGTRRIRLIANSAYAGRGFAVDRLFLHPELSLTTRASLWPCLRARAC